MKFRHLMLLLLLVFLQPALAGTIEGINHTKNTINKFSVNDQSGMDAIGPFQGGGLLLWDTSGMATRYDRQGRLGDRLGPYGMMCHFQSQKHPIPKGCLKKYDKVIDSFIEC